MLQDFTLASTSRSRRLTAIAALAYSLVIIYASLQPFSGWSMPPDRFGAFLLAPWPRWITIDDVLFNFVAYVPLGFLLGVSLSGRYGAIVMILLPACLCVALSIILESAQQYLPARIASNVDLLVNSTGGAIGALIAPIFMPQQRLGQTLTQLRLRWFISGTRGDIVLVLAGLWLIAQLHMPLIALGVGDLRTVFGLGGMFAYTPDTYLLAEASVVLLSVTGLGLLLAAASRNTGSDYWRALVLLIAGAFTLKTTVAALVLDSASPWGWMTPGLGLGLAMALVALLLLNRLSHQGRSIAALLALLAAVILVNGMPENPYRFAPAHLLTGRSSHFLSFAAMVRALSDLWPCLAILFLLLGQPWRHAGDN